MMLITTILMLLSFITSFVLAGVLPEGVSVRSSAYDLPHPLGVMTFNGEIGGYQVQLNGSIQEIHTQMKAKYPDFNHGEPPEVKYSDPNNGSLVSRNKVQPRLCIPIAGRNWQMANDGVIQEGIYYLTTVTATCGVGGRQCVRISCSYKSAIHLCNDNDYGIQPSCAYLSSYAQDIHNTCRKQNLIYAWVGGQEFDTDNYNIIVRSDSC